MVLDRHDFLDLGASKGAASTLPWQALRGRKGLGVDIGSLEGRPDANAYDCIEGDITDLVLPARFVAMSHVLEHLPDIKAVRQVVGCAAQVASDFLFV